nr:unnamed protein product [Brassica rapa]
MAAKSSAATNVSNQSGHPLKIKWLISLSEWGRFRG